MTSDATSSASGDEEGRSVVPAPSRSGGTGPRRPWYLRRATLVGAVVVAFVAVAVISDLPTRSSHAQQVSDAKSFVNEAYGYMDSCNAGLTEAVVFMGLGRVFQIWEPQAAERRRAEARERARARGLTLRQAPLESLAPTGAGA